MSEEGQGGQGNTGAGDGDGASFFDSIPDDVRGDIDEKLTGHEAFKGVENFGQLAQSYVDAKTEIETLKGQVPQVPEKTEDYKVELPKGVSLDEEANGIFKIWCLEHKVPNDLYGDLIKFDMARNQKLMEAVEAAKQVEVDACKKEYGADYEKKYEAVKGVLRTFGAEKVLGLIEKGQHPDFEHFKLLVDISEKISPDNLGEGAGGTAGKRSKTLAETLYPEQSK